MLEDSVERIVNCLEIITNRLHWCAIWLFCIAVGSCSMHKVELFVPAMEEKDANFPIEMPERCQRLPFTERVG